MINNTLPIRAAQPAPAANKAPAKPPVAANNKAAARGEGPSLREQVKIAEQLMGKPSHFQTEAQLTAYLQSMKAALPQSSYDPQGFLKSLGVVSVRAAGRVDQPVLDAVLQQPGYVPNDDNTGKEIWIQKKIYDLAKASPKAYMALLHVANPLMEAKSRLTGTWKKPLKPLFKSEPTGLTAAVRYKDAYAALDRHNLQFGPDVHGGIPSVDGPAHPTYGTYAIAMAMGFDDAAARRLGTMDVGIDNNTTPYGKTSPMPTDTMDRHFNMNRGGEDTRLIYAKAHLELAIQYAKATAYDQAEQELGCGLHSLQDLFAHGQITPSLHATLGQFPDDVDWNPVAFYEATGATQAYLQAYLKAIAS